MAEEQKIDGGNGKDHPAPQKTEEQLASERFGRYQKDPASFIELSEIVCAAIRDSHSAVGISVLIDHNDRVGMDIAQSELNYRMDYVRRQIDLAAAKARQPKIQPAGIMDFVRGRRR